MTPGMSPGFAAPGRVSDFEVKNAFVPTEHTHSFLAAGSAQPAGHNLPNTRPDDISMVDCGRTAGHRKRRYGVVHKIRHPEKDPTGLRRSTADREMLHSAVGRAKAIIAPHGPFLNEAMTELLAALDDDETGLCEPAPNLRIACAYAGEGFSSTCKC